jgi:MraZ protein
MDDRIEVWAKELTEKPFMSPENFRTALEKVMGDLSDGIE